MENNLIIGKDYIGTSAGAVILNDQGKYFLAKRNSGARDDQGKWEFPGGPVGFYQTREEAAIKDMFDRYGIKIEIIDLLGVYDVIDQKQQDHWISTTYLCRWTGGEPEI